MARIDAIVDGRGPAGPRLARRAGRHVDDRPDGAERRCPSFRQLFVADPGGATGIELDRKLFVVRKRIEHELADVGDGDAAVYFPSLSCRTLVYKGMLTTPQLARVLPRPRTTSGSSRALALVHSRFSTNTFPSWPLAHPYRYIAHNGEINTVQGNRNWMRAREALLATPLHPGPRARLPDLHARRVRHRQLRRVPRAAAPRRPPALPHAVLMMIPEAWENHDDDGRRRSAPSTSSTRR